MEKCRKHESSFLPLHLLCECGSTEFENLGEVETFAGQEIYQCKRCGLGLLVESGMQIKLFEFD